MQLRYDVFDLDARGHRRRCIAADQPLQAVTLPELASRIEAHNTNQDGHYYHWDGAEWQPCPHPIHLARSTRPAGALMSAAGRRRHYTRAVLGARQLARSGVTVAEVDAAGVTLVLHQRRYDGDRVAWPDWSRARLDEARRHRLGGPHEIGLDWRELERALDGDDTEQVQFYAALYDVATAFRACHTATDLPAAPPRQMVTPDLYRAAI